MKSVILVSDARRGREAYEKVYDPSGIWSRPSNIAYMAPSTDRQIAAVMKTYGSEKYKLLYLLAKHGIYAQSNSTNPDSFFYSKRKNAPNSTSARDEGQAAHIMYHIHLALPTAAAKEYLDVGGGNGGISLKIGMALGARITVVDTVPQAIDGASWHKDLKELPDNHFDFVTIIFALHHFKDLDGMLRDIRRVMKPGSILCIKEHDCWSAIDAMMVDIEHSIFMYGTEKIVDDHTVHFKNFTGWEAKLGEYQFAQTHMSYFCGPREEITPTRAFIALFTLEKK